MCRSLIGLLVSSHLTPISLSSVPVIGRTRNKYEVFDAIIVWQCQVHEIFLGGINAFFELLRIEEIDLNEQK